VCALLVAIGVPDAHLDGVMAVLADEDRFPTDVAHLPRNMREVAGQARRAYELYLQDVMGIENTVDADTTV